MKSKGAPADAMTSETLTFDKLSLEDSDALVDEAKDDSEKEVESEAAEAVEPCQRSGNLLGFGDGYFVGDGGTRHNLDGVMEQLVAVLNGLVLM